MPVSMLARLVALLLTNGPARDCTQNVELMLFQYCILRVALMACVGELDFLMRVSLRWFPALSFNYLCVPNRRFPS